MADFSRLLAHPSFLVFQKSQGKLPVVEGHIHMFNDSLVEVDLEFRLLFLAYLFLLSALLFFLEGIDDKLVVGRFFRGGLEKVGL